MDEINMENNEIKLTGCILKIKGKEIILTIEEAHQLKMELEKAFPTPPMIVKEPVIIPNWEPVQPWPGGPWPVQPWNVPCTPYPSPYITWCTMTYDSTDPGKIKQ
jgi:hypothetical protein